MSILEPIRTWYANRSLLAKVLLPTTVILVAGIGVLIAYMGHVSRRSTIANEVANAKAVITQYKILRSYYTRHVVAKAIERGLKAAVDHKAHADTIPLPATMIHELSEELSATDAGVKLRLYSQHPFPNRAGKPLDDFNRAALDALAARPDEPFVRVVKRDDQELVRVAIADRLTAPACVQCHNTHPQSPKKDWQLGQVRGALEVEIPLTAALDQSSVATRNAALLAAGTGAFALAFIALVTAGVTARLRKAVVVLEAVTAGDLSRRVDVKGDDEVGRMGTTLNETIGTLQQNMTEIARVNSMVENAPINMIFADRDLKILYLNPASVKQLRALRQHLPARVEDLIGSSLANFHEALAQQRDRLIDPNNLPHRTTLRVGPETVDLLVSAIYDQNKQPIGAMVTWEVITTKLAMENQIKDNAEQERRQGEDLRHKVEQILVAVNAMAAGDFTVSVADLGGDAVGQMAGSLNVAIGSIRTALAGVREVADQVADASAQLSSAADDIASGAQEQASSLEETASTLEEITATVKQNAESAQQARQLASGSREVADKGGQVVGAAVEAMGAINQSSKKIADIISTIDEIAFQTNLLALNAAVEAARAGEQGRGFAVVAAEVRNLAGRSASAAKEIKALIQDSVRKVDNGTDLVNRSGQSLGEIVTSVKRVTDIVTEIAAASKEQSSGIDQVTTAVGQMDAVTQRNASQTEEMSATAQALSGQAEQLQRLVATFKLLAEGKPAAVRRPAPVAPSRQAGRGGKQPARPPGRRALDEIGAANGEDGFQEF